MSPLIVTRLSSSRNVFERTCAVIEKTVKGGLRSNAIAEWLFAQWRKHPLAVILVIAAADAALIVLYAVGFRAPIFGEDRAVEMATAFLFLAAFVVWLLHLKLPGPCAYPILLPVAGGLGLLGFLDEISFGARLFGWSMPALMGGGEFDGAHDLVILTYRLASQADPMLIVAVAAGAAAIVVAFTIVWRRELYGLAQRILADRTYLAMALFVAGVGFASLLDLEIGILRRLGPLEEIAELNAALALLLTVISAIRAPYFVQSSAGRW